MKNINRELSTLKKSLIIFGQKFEILAIVRHWEHEIDVRNAVALSRFHEKKAALP